MAANTVKNLPKKEFLDLYAQISETFPSLTHFEAEILALKGLGFSQVEIGKYFGKAHTTIGRVIKKTHIKIPCSQHGPRGF